MKLKQLYNISRPRFWIYTLGPYLLGVISAGDPWLFNWEAVVILTVLFIFFTLPANLLIYGINDIYDYETDKHNPKKVGYEELVDPKDQVVLWRMIGLIVLPFVPLFFFLNTHASIALSVFLVTGIYYSAKPFRAKARPPLDIMFSSIIYISPAAIGFFAGGNMSISWLGVIGGLLWASAMQTYSAVPDIESDRKGSVRTLATEMGQSKALWFCFFAYLSATIIGYFYLGAVSILLGLVYLGMVMYTIRKPQKSFLLYRKFPAINTICGMILFFLMASKYLI